MRSEVFEQRYQSAKPIAFGKPPTDLDLVRRAREGDAAAFEEIMRRNNRALFRAAFGILKNDADAEEIVQETYVRAYIGFDEFEGRSRLSTWLVRIAINESLRRLGRVQRLADFRQNGPGAGGEFGQTAEEMVSQMRTDPEVAAARGEIRRVLEAAIKALPESYRSVFVLRGLEEFSVEETAECLGIPLATVKTRHHRARRLLRKILSSELDNALAGAFPFAGVRCDRIVAEVLLRTGFTTF